MIAYDNLILVVPPHPLQRENTFCNCLLSLCISQRVPSWHVSNLLNTNKRQPLEWWSACSLKSVCLSLLDIIPPPPISPYQHFDLGTLTLTFDQLLKELKLRHNFLTEIMCVYCLWQDLSVGSINFDPVALTLTFDLLVKNLPLYQNLNRKR